ncbi:hypothetical protein SAMN05660690_1167 [Geodermatophilus telluris]|uniref:Uncharacterized protein n=1 Tax=Geodermatophilus telluris TaxID=1190417 RepID=A0A1G6L2Y5_9ACTN|nr:hypothetical protein [Geodermatophilus telluris]SDC37483.1 hypothetical protein SAMN05660690_1167 [Geodermatophilus telluris]
MKALTTRLRRMVGNYALVIIIVGVGATVVLMTSGANGLWEKLLKSFVTILVFVVASTLVGVVRGLAKYRIAKATKPHEKVVEPLVTSDREYCLVLRSFGEDGQIVLPRESRRGRVGLAYGLTPNLTMEQVVATAVSESLRMPTYAIVDQSVTLAPPGLTFVRVADDQWKAVVSRLIRRAHTVVLLLGRDKEIGAGFAWEIEHLVQSGISSRVVLTLPPPDQDEYSHQRALHQAAVLLALLTSTGDLSGLERFRVLEYEMQLPPTTLVVATTETSAIRLWHLKDSATTPRAGLWNRVKAYRGPVHVTNLQYKGAMSEALAETEKQLRGNSFSARYPLGSR